MKYLESTLEIAIRFSETDAMGVVWHGNYLKFFEDAREYFGKEHGMDYLDMYKNGIVTPIVSSSIQHKASLYYGDKAKVIAKLEKAAAAKIVFHYEVINAKSNEIVATGSTKQVFMDDKDRVLELVKPDFITEWEAKQDWKSE